MDVTTAPHRRAAFPFTRLRWIGFGVIIAMLALAGAMFGLKGLNLGLDFTGGVLVEARSQTPFDAGALRQALAAQGEADAAVQLADGGTTALIRAQALEGEGPAALEAIAKALGPAAEIRNQEAVGPKVSGELFFNGVLASIAAVAAIAIYVWFRFEAKFGVAAFVTTLHDVLMLVGLYVVTGMSFDLTSIAALLAIAGYSINDTVVVFDRIRETSHREPDATIEDVIDRSVTDTMRRTLITSGTTLAASVALMALGGPVLFGFAAAVTFGVIVGTLSTIFVAAPLLLHLPGAMPGRGTPAEHPAEAGFRTEAA